MRKKVFIAGATGWAGSALSKVVFHQKDMELVGGLSASKKWGKPSRNTQPG